MSKNRTLIIWFEYLKKKIDLFIVGLIEFFWILLRNNWLMKNSENILEKVFFHFKNFLNIAAIRILWFNRMAWRKKKNLKNVAWIAEIFHCEIKVKIHASRDHFVNLNSQFVNNHQDRYLSEIEVKLFKLHFRYYNYSKFKRK